MPARPARSQGTLSAIEADVDQITRQARPSLVRVIAQHMVLTRRRAGTVPEPRPHSRVGSGVAIERNRVLTTASVVVGAEKLVVVTDNGLQVTARLIGMDPIHNVALLEVDGLELSPLRIAQRVAGPGEWVITLGSSYHAAPTQSVGNVSYRYREPRMSLLQLTNPVYPGNSGGAALNSHGELIGLVQGELGSPEGTGASSEYNRRPAGMSFVLPIEEIMPVVEILRRDGRARLGFMGVSTRASWVDSESDPGERVALGALVDAIQAGGPGAKLGLRKGDLIVAYDGERVEYPEQLARWVGATPPGTSVAVVWARDEMRHSGHVVLGESPTPVPSWMQVGPAVSDPATSASGAAPRVADLQARIRKLNRELDRLRGQQDSVR
jgi:serine protease Do